MKKLLLLLIPCLALAGTEPINIDTKTHVVKPPPTSPVAVCDFDFTGRTVCGISGSGLGTVTSFSAGTLSPLFTTSVTNPTTTPALSFSLSNAGAHTFFANNTGSTGAPSYTSFVAQTDYWDTTVFPGGNATGLVPPASAAIPPCTRFLNENGIWQCAGGDGVGGAPENAHYVTTQAESGLSNEFSIGSLGSGIIYQNVSGSVSTPAIVTIGSGLSFAAGTLSATAQSQTHAVTFVVDGSGSALSTGTKSYTKIPYGGTLTGWLLIGSPSGSITIDIFRSADGTGLPVTSIIGAGTKPTLSNAVENSSTSFTSWTSTALTAKDNMAISLSGITSTTYCALTLYYQ